VSETTATKVSHAIDGSITNLGARARAIATSPEASVPKLLGAVCLMGLADALPMVWRVGAVFAFWLAFILVVELLPWEYAGDVVQGVSGIMLQLYMVVAVVRDTLRCVRR
jgi:hypothetical protein